ncbi:PEP-utilizing enzyme [Paenibacillus albidus]|uniref:PEP-utilizing enzyme n=1 Tax=Paenibacillus albidus TaxID=2041023 RepID=UPI0020351760|nr:PEP-utilizing enzyme [Paenibacillus albidus]
MAEMIKGFAELEPELWVGAGGKGMMLSRMFQAGYPVPDGFIVMPSAFEGDQLRNKAWQQCVERLSRLRELRPDASFAVRSSALSEDSAAASFAGEFDTVLNVQMKRFGRLYLQCFIQNMPKECRYTALFKAWNQCISLQYRDTFAINDSLTGDYLWTNNNVGESISDVFTPLSWSVLRSLDEEHNVIPGQYIFSGNICGRVYANVSLSVSLFSSLGLNLKPILRKMSRVFGEIPEGMSVPVHPFSKRELVKTVLPKIIYSMKQVNEAVRNSPRHLKESPQWCREMTAKLREAQTRDELLRLWNSELWPHNVKAMWSGLEAHAAKMQKMEKLLGKLTLLVGEEDANVLLSSAGNSSKLASLGPLTGISSVVKGELSRKEYTEKYGHRGPHEFELSIPDPGEDEAWLEQQIAEYHKAPLDVQELLQQQRVRAEEASARLERNYPQKVKRLSRQIAACTEGPRLREAVRSEWTRTFRVNRVFALKAGELAGIGEDIFFLYLDEILDWLAGGELSAVRFISERKEMYLKYQSLPPLPSMIRGRFDPWIWQKDPHRRLDYYDASMPVECPDTESLRGFAGAAGRIEGQVRVLSRPEDGDQLLAGEILVAATTNVGWTPLFPRAAAIITDIGAPLSHAAIVARELGIPAVVGCGTATTRLKTGDRVVVDGGQGLIQIMS